jgi:DNA polymerase I-like protein with 3'-5' exonuclease and polymerase domains
VVDPLSQVFVDAGNTLHATPAGFRTGHEPVHQSSSGTCVVINTGKGRWSCYSCQQGGDVVAAIMSLRGVSRVDAEAYVHEHSDHDSSDASPKKTQADLLIEAAAIAVFFHDGQSDPWAIVPVGQHRETLRLRDRSFKRWLVRGMYEATGKTPNAEALSQALMLLEARAVFDGPQRPLSCRVARQGDAILYDLADPEWRAVMISAHGWELGQRPGVFRRGSNTAPQVLPQSGGNVADVLEYLPPMDEQAKLLVQTYLVTALIPDIPHPILVISGQKGAAKSTFSRVLRRLIDPAHEELLSLPNDQNELALLLARNYLPAFDNLDGIQPWQSDMLCRASTGGGISKRRLYTDDDEVVLSFRRCMVLNGIQPGVTRPDLLDRTIPFHLERMEAAQRKEEGVFWADFEEARPRLVGAMFTVLAQAMGLYPNIYLSALPRMADFCRWGYAVAEALGTKGYAFLQTYTGAINAQNTAAVENHAVAAAVIALCGGMEKIAAAADTHEFWSGTAANLLTVLDETAAAQRIDTKARSWPKAANALMRRLTEVKSNLMDIGIQAETDRDKTGCTVTFRKCAENIVTIVTTVTHPHTQGVVDDGTGDDTAATSDSTVTAPEEVVTIFEQGDDSVGRDDDTLSLLSSSSKRPTHNSFAENRDPGDDDDAIFGTPQEGCYIEVSASTDGPLPEYITTSAQLDAVLPALCTAPLLAVDTETTGLDPLKDHVRLIQFALPDRIIVIDAEQVPVQRLLPVFDATHLLAFHNAKFDLKFLRTAGLPWPTSPVFDTMLAAQLLGAGIVDGQLNQCGLATVAQRYLSLEVDKALQTSDWTGTLTPAQLCYAARDAQVALQLVSVLQRTLMDGGLAQVAAIECQCVPALAWLELVGVPFDAQSWSTRAALETNQAREHEARLGALLAQHRNGSTHLFSEAINWQSPKQVLDVLQHRGHAIAKTDSETLAALAGADPLVPVLLDYRDAEKRAGTYGLAWLDKAVHPVTGRVHADYLQLGSRAGRMSCTKPNIQNLPRNKTYRGCITAEPGSCIVKADYSQIELRIAAVLAQDAVMLAAYHNGQDLHTTTAARLLGVAPERVTSDHRQLAKAVNFGLLYGMGAPRLQTYARQHYRVSLTPIEAEQYRQRFFEAYPGLRHWHRQTGATQSTETRTLAGRRRLAVKAFTERLNSPVQGTGADGLKWALARLFAHRDEAPDARLVAVVHDELVVECPIAAAEQTSAWLQQHMGAAMTDILHDAVPVVVETTIGQDWAGTPLPEGVPL